MKPLNAVTVEESTESMLQALAVLRVKHSNRVFLSIVGEILDAMGNTMEQPELDAWTDMFGAIHHLGPDMVIDEIFKAIR